MQNNGYVWGVILAILIVIAAIFIFRSHNATAPSTTASSTATTATSPQIGGQMATSSNGQVHATGTLTGSAGITPPTLSSAIIIAPNISADQAAQLQTKEQPHISQLKATPTRVDLWLQLGLYRKEAGDYAGAIAAWNYVAAVGPVTINFIAYGNLGDLYQNFDVNYPKAEANYLAAIKLKPSDVGYYVDLYNLYRYQYKTNTTAAADIVTQGLKANPNNADLLALQKQL